MNDLGRRTMRKVIWRLVPYLALLYTFNIIDRANVGFARLGMVDSLGFSNSVIDWATESSTSATCSSRCRATCSCAGSAPAAGSRGS